MLPTFEPVEFADLPGWAEDDLTAALPAFQRSCQRLIRLPEDAPLDPKTRSPLYGLAGDWRDVCRQAAATRPADARAFFEAAFEPREVMVADAQGLFTGYYEPEINGARHQGGAYQVPLFGPPADLVTVDLGRFDSRFAGESIRGRIASGDFIPYFDRSEIEDGAIADRAAVLVWLADPVDAFFAHIQGSARINLAEGGQMRVAFANKNGRPYTAIGKVLVDRGALTGDQVSMQTIRAWLAENPTARDLILRHNQSYIFFREAPLGNAALGAPGAEGVQLTPGRSLAVDRQIHALGAPLFVASTAPTGPDGADQTPQLEPFNRLMVAQDTGSAIKGPIRGDVYWGLGDEAARPAGHMKSPGRLFVLLPKGLADKVLSGRT